MLSTTASYRAIAGNMPRILAATAANRSVQTETNYYRAHIGSVRSLDQLLGDKRLFAYAMKAFGLADMSFARGFMRQVLSGGIDLRDTLANRLTDPRYKEFVAAFNFVRYGAATTSFDVVQNGVVERYLRQQVEEDTGHLNEGVRLALYFQRRIQDVSSVHSVLADPALMKVVSTVLRLPSSSTNIELLSRTIGARLDLGALKTPDGLRHFLARFTTLWDSDNATVTAVVPMITGSRTAQLTPELLARLQKVRPGL